MEDQKQPMEPPAKQPVAVEDAVSAILAGMVSVVPFITWPWISDSIVVPKIFVMAALLAGVGLVYGPAIFHRVAGRRRAGEKPSLPVRLALIYLVLITVTLPFTMDLNRSLIGVFSRREGYFVLVMYIAFFLLAAGFYRFRAWHLKLYLTAVSLMACHAIFIRYEGLFGIDAGTTRVLAFRFTGCGYQNFLGSYMVLALPVAVYAALRGNRKAWIAVALVFFGLLVSNTRGAWIGGGIATLVMAVLVLKGANRRWFLTLCGVFTGVAALYLCTNATFAARFQTTESIGQRFFIYSLVLRLIAARPFTGWGIETLDLVTTRYFGEEITAFFGRTVIMDRAHCEILQVACSCGIPAAAAFIAAQIAVVVRGIRNFDREALWTPLLFSVAGYMIGALGNISVVNVAPTFWIFCGVLVASITHGEAMHSH